MREDGEFESGLRALRFELLRLEVCDDDGMVKKKDPPRACGAKIVWKLARLLSS